MPAPSGIAARLAAALPLLFSLAALVTCLLLIDLKGISTDEGIRLGIINGGRPFTPAVQPAPATSDVLRAVTPFAYQPAYYVLQNALMRAFARHDPNFFRLVNIACLAVCLVGLLGLTRRWSPLARTFLIILFGFNAYLFMHVLQIREYIVAVALYIWGTRLVLFLDERPLAREWPDVFWFWLYGLTMTAAFYVQTWTVFPAIAQGLFLVLRRRPQLVRFLAHLAFSYLVVFILVWPYLRSNTQKVNIGLWASRKVTLLGELHQGFNLVLAGELAGHDLFTSVLPFVWAALAIGGAFAAWHWRRKLPAPFLRETGRCAWLLLLSSAVTLAFQIGYFYKVEPLSVWPRYFIIHTFFLTALIALAVHVLATARAAGLGRRVCTAVLAGAAGLLVVSAVVQVRSYWHNPYYDSGTNRASNWPAIARAVRAVLRPDDVVFTHDFVARSTLTATDPLSNPAPTLRELETVDLGRAPRLLYLESSFSREERPELVRRMAARGYPVLHEWPVPAGDGSGPLPEWRILTFSRP